MKTIFYILAAVALCSSCIKKQVSSPAAFFGKYELHRSYGGLYYRDSTYKPGNGTIYQFNSDSTYKHFINGKQDTMGVYHIKLNTDATSAAYIPKLIFFDNTRYGEAFASKTNGITIGTSVDDGIAVDYQKIADQ